VTRAIYRYVNMTLSADPDAEAAIIEATCTTCSATSQPEIGDSPTEQREKAEKWCLEHTGQADDYGRHHTGFRATVTMFWRVTPEEELDPSQVIPTMRSDSNGDQVRGEGEA